MRRIFAVTALALLFAAAPLVAQDRESIPELAKRCEAVKWSTAIGSSHLVPEDLLKIARELEARGPDAMDAIAESLPHSLHLRRIAPGVVEEWPSDQARKMLIDLLADRDEMAAHGAAFSLGTLGGREVVAPLIEAATKRGGMVRHNVVNALPRIGALYKGLDLAIACATDRQPWNRHSAYQCLEHVDWDAGIERALNTLTIAADAETDGGAKAAAQRAIRVLRARRP